MKFTIKWVSRSGVTLYYIRSEKGHRMYTFFLQNNNLIASFPVPPPRSSSCSYRITKYHGGLLIKTAQRHVPNLYIQNWNRDHLHPWSMEDAPFSKLHPFQ